MKILDLRPITEKQKSQYNKIATHVMQSWEWGEARKALGTPVFRYGIFANDKLKTAFQLILHKIPFTNFNVGYLPKGPFPDGAFTNALKAIGKAHKCAFIKLEPSVIASEAKQSIPKVFHLSPKPLFTKYNFIVDLTKSEDELLKNMHPKTRYNILVAQKHKVTVKESVDDEAFRVYLRLYFETTRRQGYHGHNENYHQKIWDTLKDMGMARLLIASFKNKPLTAWMLLNFKDTLYYPYGGSSVEHKEVMANNLIAWEAIKLGKKMGLKSFDMWGADSRRGFHKFKAGYRGKLVEYIGTFDLVFNWPIYLIFTFIDKLMPLKVFLLKWISH
ncbi:MAG: FemAB family protein [Microgenomates group bacterium Gr01-1014_7]|nr:MAG: FemAB family protein [Microgenomates group bacterium Gr01-1014_7]